MGQVTIQQAWNVLQARATTEPFIAEVLRSAMLEAALIAQAEKQQEPEPEAEEE